MAESSIPTSSRPDVSIEISNRQSLLPIDTRFWSRLVLQILADEKIRRGSVSIAVVDNAAIRQLNRHHLDHDYATDVLSFVFEHQGDRLDGEIVLNAEIAIERAPEFGFSPTEELTLYLIHGTLHLVGYDDHSDAERKRMQRRQEHYLKSSDPSI
jgi:probable rRNA maturation factor